MKNLLLVGLLTAVSSVYAVNESNVVYQVAPVTALAKGIDQSNYSYQRLEQHGDFGLGTFQNLDGEMVALNGKFYQMLADGNVMLVKKSQTTPFAEVIFFKQNQPTLAVSNVNGYNKLQQILLTQFKNKNTPYAIRIDGEFLTIKARAAHSSGPHTTLTEAAKNQTVFDFNHVKGTLVGYWFPDYLSNVAVKGFHLHFIDDKRKHGGHVLDLQIKSGDIHIQQISNLNLYFPDNADFESANLVDEKIQQEIQHAENSKK